MSILSHHILITGDATGNVVVGSFHCRKSDTNSRELEVEIHYALKESADASAVGDVVVQMYKVR